MPKKEARVDAYIRTSAPFARPILKRIRTTWHKACPDIEETIKWGIPYFQKNGLVGGMAAFKAHVSLGFWKAKEMNDPEGILDDGSGICAARMTGIGDLPPETVLIDYIREAVALNDTGPAKKKRERKAVKVPDTPSDFRNALRRKSGALAAFGGFAPSRRKEYIEWILEAKKPETRERRIAQAVEWIAEGKPRHWKHMK